MPTASPRVAIVIVNWNGVDDTTDCLESLKHTDYENYSAIVVDNGSSDDSEVKLRSRFPEHTVLQAGSNLGFAGASNLGMQRGLANGADYLLLLNNDTRVDSAAVSRLVAESESDAKTGITGAMIAQMSHPGKVWAFGGIFNVNTGYAKHFLSEAEAQLCKIQPPLYLYVPGCVMLIRRECLEDSGFLNERFFHLAEDVDFCVRVQRRGWKLALAAGALVFHRGSASLGRFSPLYNYYEQRNRLFVIQAHYMHRDSVRSTLWDGLMILGRLFLTLGKIDRVRNFFCGARLLGLAVYDFLRGRDGNREDDPCYHSVSSLPKRRPCRREGDL